MVVSFFLTHLLLEVASPTIILSSLFRCHWSSRSKGLDWWRRSKAYTRSKYLPLRRPTYTQKHNGIGEHFSFSSGCLLGLEDILANGVATLSPTFSTALGGNWLGKANKSRPLECGEVNQTRRSQSQGVGVRRHIKNLFTKPLNLWLASNRLPRWWTSNQDHYYYLTNELITLLGWEWESTVRLKTKKQILEAKSEGGTSPYL